MCMYNRPLPDLGTADDRTLLCNSYNRITVEMNLCSFRSVCFCVVVHSYSFENCIAYFHSSKSDIISYRILYRVTCIRLGCKTYP
jgi:hypothetical protein